MIDWDVWIAFLAFAVPMIISPGPGNTLLTTAGARLGVRGSLRCWVGFEAANLFLCLIIGFGFSRVFAASPQIESTVKWAGILYILYLAWTFARPSSAQTIGDRQAYRAHIGLKEGFLSVLLNPKIHSMILVMFSQFLVPERSLAGQVLQLSTAFLAVGLFCHFLWIYAGQVILGRFRSDKALKVQNWLFGASLLAVAGYMAFAQS